MSPSTKRDFEISFWGESSRHIEKKRRAERELEEHLVNIQAFAIINTEQFFLQFLSLYA